MDALFHTTVHVVYWLGRRAVAATTQVRHLVWTFACAGRRSVSGTMIVHALQSTRRTHPHHAHTAPPPPPRPQQPL